MTKWIKVSDRMPETFIRVLIFCEYGALSAILCSGYWRIDPMGDYATGGIVYDVTHWMPLPEAPND